MKKNTYHFSFLLTMFEPNLIIEFGGGNTSILKKNSGLILKEPSFLASVQNGESYQIKAIGQEAKKLGMIEDSNINVFSPFSEGKVFSHKYSVVLLDYLLKQLKAKKFNNSAVVCVPCGLEPSEHESFANLCHSCSINRVKFVHSVAGIAFANGLNTYSPKYKFVVDIGASTTDVAVVSFSGIVFGATLCIGGRSMNLAIENMVKEIYSVKISMSTAEKIKEELATLLDNDTSIMRVQGYNLETETETIITIKAEDVKKALIPYYIEISHLIETTLNLCNDYMLMEFKQTGLLFSGGCSKITGLERFFKNRLQLPVIVSEDCDDDVMKGVQMLLKNKELLNKICF